MAGTVAAVVVVVALVVVLARPFALVARDQAGVVEMFGRYRRTVGGGFSVLIPLLERVRARVDMGVQTLTLPAQPLVAADQLLVWAGGVTIGLQVTDPRAAVYEVADYRVAVEQLAVTVLRTAAGERTAAQLLDDRGGQLRLRLMRVLPDAVSAWGLRILRVDVPPLQVPDPADPLRLGEAAERPQP